LECEVEVGYGQLEIYLSQPGPGQILAQELLRHGLYHQSLNSRARPWDVQPASPSRAVPFDVADECIGGRSARRAERIDHPRNTRRDPG
jgi:hypothetical protein